MYNVYHGSWRDFGTAVGVILAREGQGVLSGDDKLTTANLCDRKKSAEVCAIDVMTHQ